MVRVFRQVIKIQMFRPHLVFLATCVVLFVNCMRFLWLLRTFARAHNSFLVGVISRARFLSIIGTTTTIMMMMMMMMMRLMVWVPPELNWTLNECVGRGGGFIFFKFPRLHLW
jgi:hypothetical protein